MLRCSDPDGTSHYALEDVWRWRMWGSVWGMEVEDVEMQWKQGINREFHELVACGCWVCPKLGMTKA